MNILFSISATINVIFTTLFLALYFQWIMFAPSNVVKKEEVTPKEKISSTEEESEVIAHDFSAEAPASFKNKKGTL